MYPSVTSFAVKMDLPGIDHRMDHNTSELLPGSVETDLPATTSLGAVVVITNESNSSFPLPIPPRRHASILKHRAFCVQPIADEFVTETDISGNLIYTKPNAVSADGCNHRGLYEIDSSALSCSSLLSRSRCDSLSKRSSFSASQTDGEKSPSQLDAADANGNGAGSAEEVEATSSTEPIHAQTPQCAPQPHPSDSAPTLTSGDLSSGGAVEPIVLFTPQLPPPFIEKQVTLSVRLTTNAAALGTASANSTLTVPDRRKGRSGNGSVDSTGPEKNALIHIHCNKQTASVRTKARRRPSIEENESRRKIQFADEHGRDLCNYFFYDVEPRSRPGANKDPLCGLFSFIGACSRSHEL